MGSHAFDFGLPVRPVTARRSLLTALVAILIASLALAGLVGAGSPATAQATAPVGIRVIEEVPGQPDYYMSVVHCWQVTFTATNGAFQQAYPVCTDDANDYGVIEGVPAGEYWIEVVDPNGRYDVALNPNSPFTIPYVDTSIEFVAVSTEVPNEEPTEVPTEVPPTINTPTGSGVMVQPGAGATITFDTVTVPGETAIGWTDTAPALPEGYLQAGATFYDVFTSAAFAGSVTICLPYDPATIDAATVSILHYEDGAWVDVTSSVDPAGVVCGVVSSFSPFAVAPRAVVAATIVGFHSPVTMGDGVVNTVKGGSTVPLKFNVYRGGVEVTDATAVWVDIAPVGCAGGASDPIDGVTQAGGTGLRYAGTPGVDGLFVQQWKTPKVSTVTCYAVTAGTANGSSVTAIVQINP